MKVNSQRDISFKGFYNNKALKKGLEFAADNGALFAATATLTLSMFARPASIWLAPHTDKENKRVACAKSIASSLAQFGLTFLLSKPVANAVEKIDKNPEKYLKKSTLQFMDIANKAAGKSKQYEFATQMFKLGVGFVVAIPKAVLTAACMPFVLQKIFHRHDKPHNENKNVSFKGKGNDKLAKGIGKILDSKGMQEFSEKHKDSNFVMHMVAATDALTTAMFINETYKSDKIEERRKKALIYNAGISTGLSIISGYIVDRLLDKPTQKFIEKFKKANKGLPNLEKQIEGIKIAKPILLVGAIYYMAIPFISTFLADIADHNPKLDIPHKNAKKSHSTST